MRLTVLDLLDFLDQVAPLSLAERNDPIGLQVGSLKVEVKGILLTVDAGFNSCKLAKEKGLNLIIAHHPLIYQPLQSVSPDSFPGNVVYFAVKEDINIISWHTPLDKVSWGVSFALAESLGFEVEAPILPDTTSKDSFGLGVVAKLPKSVKLRELASSIAKAIKSWVMLVGDEEIEVDRVGICGGSGSFLLESLRRLSINTFLTSDVKFHAAKKAEEEGFNFILVDHGVSEKFVLPKLREKLLEYIAGRGFQVPVLIYDEKSPFKPYSNLQEVRSSDAG